MKRILVILPFLLFIAITGNAQKDMFSKMPLKQRDSTLIDIGKKALLKYAPDYYREYKTPEIFLKKTFHEKDLARFFYEVTFLYDPLKEKYGTDYIAKVYIWADSRKAFRIKFMNEWGFDIEGAEKKKSTNIMPFVVPQPFEGTPLPRDTNKVIKRTAAKVYKFPK